MPEEGLTDAALLAPKEEGPEAALLIIIRACEQVLFMSPYFFRSFCLADEKYRNFHRNFQKRNLLRSLEFTGIGLYFCKKCKKVRKKCNNIMTRLLPALQGVL